MSARKMIFPPKPGRGPGPDPQPSVGSFLDEEDDLYTGQPDFGGQDPVMPDAGQQAGGTFRGTAKGHAAYSSASGSPEETPHYAHRGAGFGPTGGMFANDPAGPAGHAAQGQSAGEGLLSVVTDDALAAECQKRVCPSCSVKKEADDIHLRALADLENTKKRLIREREEQARFAAESVLSDIIPSLDNLDLALQHAGGLKECKDFVVGVRMTRKLMQEALAKHGLQQTGAVGEEFNPAVHEAVGMVNAPDVPNGHVCGLLSSGYKLHDRLLRPARVMVCKKG